MLRALKEASFSHKRRRLYKTATPSAASTAVKRRVGSDATLGRRKRWMGGLAPGSSSSHNVWHGSALVPAQATSWSLALALRLAAQLFSILASLISSPCRQTTSTHSMSRSIARYGPPDSGLHGRIVAVQAANHFEGHLEMPAVSGSVRRSILRLLLAPGSFGLSRPVGLSASAPHT
ncbi:hypothetical protein THAR02_04199 [Trichoderma harzianum]|uniref:Uncharacterized protein n=1 Tax=Trichoderma harzianum TaxID=5544 RepID=A0A0F9XUB9_TRIHA|nr:hypothetical protein THAR02_04199 [Trichoderma harzianum]